MKKCCKNIKAELRTGLCSPSMDECFKEMSAPALKRNHGASICSEDMFFEGKYRDEMDESN